MADIGIALLAAVLALGGPTKSDSPWDSFPVFVWRGAPRDEAMQEELVRSFGGFTVERDESPDWLRTTDVFYVGHGPGRNILHTERDREPYRTQREAWIEDRDTQRLHRHPCLSDDETRATLTAKLDRSLAARSGNHGVGVSLGDEVSLTPWGDPIDLCRAPACERAWSERRASESAEFPATDAARVALVEGQLERLEPWLDRRRFHRDVLTDLLGALATRVRAVAPGTPVGLLGIGGETPFGGVAIERVLPTLDFIEPYAVGDARELVGTLRKSEQRVLATLALDAITPDEAVERVYEHWQRGVDGLVVYRDRELLRDKPTRERLAAAIAWVRSARELVGGSLGPVPSGVALIHDSDSHRLAWLRDAAREGPSWPELLAGYQERTGTYERARWRWLRALEDVGVFPGALPVEHIDEHTVVRFPTLVASHLAVLSDENRGRLERFLEAGGNLWIDGPFAAMRSDGRSRAQDLLARWMEQFGERIRTAPPGLERYSRVRTQQPVPSHAASFREELDAALTQQGVGRPPLALSPSGGPWLVTSRIEADGSWLVAVRAQAGLSSPLETLPLKPGYSLEWLIGPGQPVAVARVSPTEEQ